MLIAAVESINKIKSVISNEHDFVCVRASSIDCELAACILSFDQFVNTTAELWLPLQTSKNEQREEKKSEVREVNA